VLLENIINFKFHRKIKLKIISEKIKGGLIRKYLMAYKLRKAFNDIEKKEGKFDLLISTLPFCDEIVKIAKIRDIHFRIANTLGSEIESLKKLNPNKANRRLSRYKALYNSQKIIAVSQGVRDDLVNTLKIKSDISVIYNPFNFSSIRKLASKPILKNIKKPYLIHVGRFASQKRHDLLLDAWKLANLNMQLLLITNKSKALEEMIFEKGLNNSVKIIGFQKNPYPYIRQSEMLILCSDRCGLPNVLVEGLICGTRVISSDCPSGPSEILTGNLKKFLFAPGSPQSLAKHIKHFIKLPKPKGFSLERFSDKNFIKKYLALAED
jgi:glycosyltransferase involved in cell wall biosynthesis